MDDNIIKYYFEDLHVGMEADCSRVVTDQDICKYAELSGDYNPVHLDEEYAKKTIFKGRIAHGMLSAAGISSVFGMKLPGPGCIYVSQDLCFKAPVRIGDIVNTKVSIVELVQEKKQAKFKTTCLVEGRIVIEGFAVLRIPSRQR